MAPAQRKSPGPSPLEELQAVSEIGKVLTSTLELSQVLERVLEQVSALLRPRRWSLLLTVPDTDRLRFEIAVGEGAEHLRGGTVAVGEGVVGWAASRGEPVLVPDVSADPRWAGRFDAETGFTTVSVLAVPLRARGQTLGVIELVAGAEDAPFGEDDLRVLSYVADYAAIAVDNARNYERVQILSTRDEHTGLYNARHLFSVLEAEARRTERYHHPFSLVFFDLDRFKQVNDTHGHLAGSALLQEVGEILRGACRTTDVPCRYGGDEFVVLLPETGRDTALLVAERIRGAVGEARFLTARGLDVRITASFGVATFPDDAEDVEALVRLSDLAMYAAKDGGRDAVRAACSLGPERVSGT